MTETIVSSQEESSTLLLGVSKSAEALSSKELMESIERGDLTARVMAMQTLIRLHVNGEPQNHMIMPVIRYIVPIDDHLVKKLVLYFWEVVDKRDAEGKLLPLMILICSFLRNDLLHPNEYVRGLTLRFLCKVNELDLIEPLVSVVTQNLTHRVAYVRRNAVLTVHHIFEKFPKLIPDAVDRVVSFIAEEADVSARRGAFDMLATFAPDRAARFLSEYRDSNNLTSAGAPFLLAIVDFCHKMIKANPYEKAHYVPILLSVMQNKSAAVRFQCAHTLLGLSSSPTAIRQATLAYVDLIRTHSDNNVRLIVADQLEEMRASYLPVLQDSLLDILSLLRDGTMEIRQRVVRLAVSLITGRNADAFMQAMKKELVRASRMDAEVEDTSVATNYRLMVIRAMSQALTLHPPSAPAMLPVLLDYVCDATSTSLEVITLVKEVLLVQPALRATTLKKLHELFPMMTSSAVLRTAMWIFGTYSDTAEVACASLNLLQEAVGPLPLQAREKAVQEGGAAAASPSGPEMRAVTTVREDGTYMMSYQPVNGPGAVVGAAERTTVEEELDSGLRTALASGDYFVAAAMASTLTKLVVQLFTACASSVAAETRAAAQKEAIHMVQAVLDFGTLGEAKSIDEDAHEHLRLHLQLLQNPGAAFCINMIESSTSALARVERHEEGGRGVKSAKDKSGAAPQLTAVDAPVVFSQLSAGRDAIYELEAAGAETEASEASKVDAYLRKIEGTVPLSGFSDPVYCEACVTVDQFDVAVDWLLVNRTSFPLTEVTIELVSLGGMKLCERPQVYTLAPHASLKVRTPLKVSATETGVIYGTVLYDAPNSERCSVILNDIHVDIMNYIRPAPCTQAVFRSKWIAFDWENKITITTSKRDVQELVDFIRQELNMQLLDAESGAEEAASDAKEMDAMLAALNAAKKKNKTGSSTTPDRAGHEEGEEEDDDAFEDNYAYTSSNLYAQTVFGEDALANVSVESDGRGTVSGVVRVRSNTQTIAYGIGEKLNVLQKAGKL